MAVVIVDRNGIVNPRELATPAVADNTTVQPTTNRPDFFTALGLGREKPVVATPYRTIDEAKDAIASMLFQDGKIKHAEGPLRDLALKFLKEYKGWQAAGKNIPYEQLKWANANLLALDPERKKQHGSKLPDRKEERKTEGRDHAERQGKEKERERGKKEEKGEKHKEKEKETKEKDVGKDRGREKESGTKKPEEKKDQKERRHEEHGKEDRREAKGKDEAKGKEREKEKGKEQEKGKEKGKEQEKGKEREREQERGKEREKEPKKAETPKEESAKPDSGRAKPTEPPAAKEKFNYDKFGSAPANDPAKLAQWTIKVAEAQGIKIDPQALNLVCLRGYDLENGRGDNRSSGYNDMAIRLYKDGTGKFVAYAGKATVDSTLTDTVGTGVHVPDVNGDGAPDVAFIVEGQTIEYKLGRYEGERAFVPVDGQKIKVYRDLDHDGLPEKDRTYYADAILVHPKVSYYDPDDSKNRPSSLGCIVPQGGPERFDRDYAALAEQLGGKIKVTVLDATLTPDEQLAQSEPRPNLLERLFGSKRS